MAFRERFSLTPGEQQVFVNALLSAYDTTGLKDLGKELGLDRQFAGSNDMELATNLLQLADRYGLVRRLLRIAGRHTNPELRERVREYLFRSFDDDTQLAILAEHFDKLASSSWDQLKELLRHHVGDRTSEMGMPRWDRAPQSQTDFRSRCREVIEILCELPECPDVALSIPLLHFVRDVFCTPLGSEIPDLRIWLRRAAARRLIKLYDLALAGWQTPEQLQKLAAEASDRLGMGISVIPHRLPPGEPITWEVVQKIPAIKVAVILDTLERLVDKPVTEPEQEGAGNPAGSSRRMPGPSYSPVLVLTSNLVLPPNIQADLATRVPHSFLCLRSWSLDDEDVRQLKIAVTCMPERDLPEFGETPGPVPEVLAQLAGDELILIVGPSVSGAAWRTSGVRLAHELLTALESRFGTVHPLVSLDAAAYLYSVKRKRESMIESVRTWLGSRPDALPKEYLNIARLFKSVAGTNATGRPRKQLIVTTNVDLLLERALMWEGVAFTRIVQSGTRTVSNRYDVEFSERHGRSILKEKPALDLRPTNLPAHQQLENAISTYASDRARQSANARKPWEPDDPPLVLYKYHGSVDLPDTLVLSVSDYAQRSVDATTAVPGDIRTAASNRRWLFVGYTLLDPQLRHLRSSLLTESQRADHVVLQCGLSEDCLDTKTLCIERLVWDEMALRWRDEHWAEPAAVDGCTFLDELVEAAS